uniref:SET domain-containing protein n=1 Tax=Globodera rostochiensis TaxID=31243 RepID=A0A914HC27_GLORO
MFYKKEDLASGTEAGGPLRAVNEWNFEQLADFDYSASSEAAAGLTFAPPDNDAAVGRLARPKVGGFEIFYASPVKKWGLRTTMQNKNIDEDTPLFEYGGELREDDDKPVEKDDYIFTFEYQNRHFVLDACRRGNLARFVNHSCMPNCYTRLALLQQATTATTGDAVPCGEDDMVPHLMICASRKILAGEELTLDYGAAWWDAKRASEDLHCNCNTARCRYKKTTIGGGGEAS